MPGNHARIRVAQIFRDDHQAATGVRQCTGMSMTQGVKPYGLELRGLARRTHRSRSI
jgi:hypothetical protein